MVARSSLSREDLIPALGKAIGNGYAGGGMLSDLWSQIVARRRDDVAIWCPRGAVDVTFGSIDRRADEIDVTGDLVPAIGESADFFPSLIAAWRCGKPALLLENGGSIIRPIRGIIPAGTALVKQACGASGIERSLFFGQEQIVAEGQRNIKALGLHPGRRGLAAISLAHSYGFGCLALPLLMGGIPLEIVAGPLPMFVQPALDRGGKVFIPGVPAIWKTWWQTGLAAHPVISLALSAGAPLSLELEAAIYSECGLKIHNFYGTSETGAIALDRSGSPRSHADFVGETMPGVGADVDDSGRIRVTSDALAIQSDQNAWIGEFENPAYRTLDEGEVLGERIFLSRCIGDAINVAGRKVSPNRLQTILEQIEGVSEAIVEGGRSRDFERFGEIRVRIMVNDSADKNAIREQLRERVESWEMPRHWTFVTTGGPTPI